MELIWDEVKLGHHLQTDLYWVRSHRWRAGHKWNGITLPCYALYLVRQGALHLTLDGQSVELVAGDAYLHAHVQQRTIHTLHDTTWFSLGLTATFYGNIDALAPLAPAHWQPSRRERIESWLDTLAREDDAGTLAGSLVSDGLSRAVVGWCWQSLQGDLYQLARRELPDWLEQALDVLRKSPTATVDEMVQHSGYSAAQFRRRFQHAMGCSPRDYLIRRRLEAGRQLLLTDELSVAAIAEQCGFHDPAQFSRYFKRAYGVPPLRFRQIVLQQVE